MKERIELGIAPDMVVCCNPPPSLIYSHIHFMLCDSKIAICGGAPAMRGGGTKGVNMGLPVFSGAISDQEMDRMMASSAAAANLLKAISHEGRLMILCNLVAADKTVSEP